MGARSHRQLRAALSFVIRPLLLAVLVTVFFRSLFSPRSTKPKAAPTARKETTKALVIASTSDLSDSQSAWISQVPASWVVHNYVTDAQTSPELSVPVNKGNEAMVYLTYIIDHYDRLPDVVFFHHAHHTAWHQALDSLTEVTSLRASYVARRGYVSARCLPGCENLIPLADHSVDADKFALVGRDVQIASLLDEFLDRSRGEAVPRRLAAPCCAQFAASRAAITGRPRDWWVRLRQWLIDTPLDSMTSGRLMEHTWHIWLGESAE